MGFDCAILPRVFEELPRKVMRHCHEAGMGLIL